MKAKITLEDSKREEVVVDISNRNDFCYKDSYNGINRVRVYDDGISIIRKDGNHLTEVVLRDNPHIDVISSEGTFRFLVKIVEINRNFDIITIVYRIDEEKRKITVKYLGA